ncbi:hypothetical protein AUJ14_06035 [Candidatus Micrarchaeota archaeon CG1_02_55_22]|nr:MAG: hypothetical protein AUJ14_06035 [Candidatus Micrarchaeota archaeon CG1_02_55_22]
MSLKTIRKLASRVFNAGVSRVRIRDNAKVKDALSADDVRQLEKEGAIELLPVKGVGRGKARKRDTRKKLGRRMGAGRRKGTSKAVMTPKTKWISKIRAQRELLHKLRPRLVEGAYGTLYRRVKGNNFRDRKHLLTTIEENYLRTDSK